MKTSIILIVLLFLNTSVIVAEPIANLISGINIWLLLLLEGLLVLGYYLNNCIRAINEKCNLDANNLRLYITKKKAN